MKREVVVAVAAAAIITGLAGCTKHLASKPTTSSSATRSTTTASATQSRRGSTTTATTTSAAGSTTATPSSSQAAGPPPKVLIGGQDQHVSGPITCTPTGTQLSIGVGQPPNVSAVLNNASTATTTSQGPSSTLQLQRIAITNVGGYTMQSPPAIVLGPQATRNGNEYTIKGTAPFTDPNNHTVQEPFEIDATCPS